VHSEPSLLVITEELGLHFSGGKYLILGGSIEVNHKITIFTTELDRFARAGPIDDATLAILRIQVDSNVVGSRPPTTTATDLKVVNPRHLYVH